MKRNLKYLIFFGIFILILFVLGMFGYLERKKHENNINRSGMADVADDENSMPPAGPPSVNMDEKSIKDLILSDPENNKAKIYLADIMIQQNNKYDESAVLLNNMLSHDLMPREKFWAYLLLSEEARMRAKYRQGIAGTENDKDFSQGSMELEEAKNLIERASFLPGEKQKALIRLGSACMGRCNFKEAEKHFISAADIGGHPYYSAFALTQAAHCMQNREAKTEALQIAKKLEKILDENKMYIYSDLMCLLGQVYYETNEYHKAKIWLDRTIKASPYSSIGLEAYIYLAWIDLQTGDRKSASAELVKVLNGLNKVYISPENVPQGTGNTLFGMMLFTFNEMESCMKAYSDRERKILLYHASKANEYFKTGKNKEMVKEMKIILDRMKHGRSGIKKS